MSLVRKVSTAEDVPSSPQAVASCIPKNVARDTAAVDTQAQAQAQVQAQAPEYLALEAARRDPDAADSAPGKSVDCIELL